MDDQRSLGHKALTIENWAQADPAMAHFGGPDSTGNFQSLDQDIWAREVLSCKLAGDVPVDIRRLHDVARGAMLYAYFFYPIMTLAAEQLYRVVDAALATRTRHLDPRRTFGQRINAAIKEGVISEKERLRWEAVRELRNMASHSESQSIYAPGMALTTLAIATDQINDLFSSKTGQ